MGEVNRVSNKFIDLKVFSLNNLNHFIYSGQELVIDSTLPVAGIGPSSRTNVPLYVSSDI